LAEVPTTSARRAATDAPRTTLPRTDRTTTVFPGYTVWQGYYWYNSPTAGWQYWDGSRWLSFNAQQR
jgi:hypothetical protein